MQYKLYPLNEKKEKYTPLASFVLSLVFQDHRHPLHVLSVFPPLSLATVKQLCTLRAIC